MLTPLLIIALTLASPQGRGHDKGLPPGQAKKLEGGVPPGLAKKGGLPPGLAKKFRRRMDRPCVAVDPRRPDRVYLLIDGRWQLQSGLSVSLQAEVRDLLRLPAAPPPVPLPKIGVDLHVVLFD